MKLFMQVPVSFRVLLGLLPVVAFGQTTATKSDDATTAEVKTIELSPEAAPSAEEKVIELNPFVVVGEPPTRYQAAEATSATRIAVDLFASSSTINVLTPAFIKDINPIKAIDSLKYVSGIAESTQPVGGDRIQVRGFQTDGQVLDGFARIGPYNHLETYLLDSVEVVKGPNAILNPSGQPGGTVRPSELPRRRLQAPGRHCYTVHQVRQQWVTHLRPLQAPRGDHQRAQRVAPRDLLHPTRDPSAEGREIVGEEEVVRRSWAEHGSAGRDLAR